MPIYSPTGYLDITNATLRTSNIETSNIKIGSANLFITTGNVSDEVFQFTNVTTGLVTTGNVEIGGSITAPDGVTDIKSNLIVEGNVEAAALRLNSVSISPVYTIASGSGTIDFQGAPTSLTASANIEVTGNVIAHQFHGDGSGLTGIPPTAITGTLSQWTNVTVDEVYFNGNVGIANTNPGYDLNVGSNLFVDDDGSNVLVVDGNVSATYFEGDGSKLTGLVTTLESVANIGNSTTNVIQFTNETTGFVTDANAVIGSNLTISGLTAQKVPYVDAQKVLRDSYITTSTGLTSIDSNLSVTGNMFVYGERFFIESESQLLKDPIIGLANNNVDQNIDIGILMQRPTSNVGIIHHGGTNELTLGYTQSNLTASEIINDLSQELTVNVIGNVVTQNNLSVGGTLTINTISAASSHSLSAVSNVGNTTSNTVQFTNPTTSLVASGNVEVGGNVVAGYLYGDGSNITGISSNLDQVVNIGNVTSNTVQFTNATTGLVTTGNVEVGGELTVSGNVAVDTNTLFVDTVGNKVGCGTSTPGQKLSIYTGSTNTAALSFDRHSSGNYRTDIYQNSYGADFRVGYGSYTPESVLYLKRLSDGTKEVEINGNVGLGTSPDYKFDVRNGSGDAITTFQVRTAGEIYIGRNHSLSPYISTSMSSARPGINLSSDGGTWRIRKFSANLDFDWQGATKGYLLSSGSGQMNFTGQHRTFIKDTPFTEAENLEGLIVSADNNKYIKMSGGIETGLNAITTNESLPVVSLSTKVKDKKCFGVISASEDPETREDAFGNFVSITQKEVGDTRVYINSVGEGAIWVSNIGGSLESGDYITTSTVKGYGQKQDSDSLKNYTVAKITMDCDFDPVTQPVQVIKKDEDGENILDDHGQIQWEDHPTETEKAYKIRYLDADGVETGEASAVHKAAFVGCTYHCG